MGNCCIKASEENQIDDKIKNTRSRELIDISYEISTNIRRGIINKEVEILVEEIENAIKGHDVTFSGFVIQACDYALKNMNNKIENK